MAPEKGPINSQGSPAATMSPLIASGLRVPDATNSGRAAIKTPLPTLEMVKAVRSRR